MIAKYEGIVIRNVDYGESAKIVTIFSRELGKVGMMARGAKKPNSKFAGITQLFHHGHYLSYQGSGLGQLQQGETVHAFRKIREDIFLAAYAMYMAELIDRAIEEKKKQSALYDFFLQTLMYMEEGFDGEILLNIFETKILDLFGITPQLNHCVSCRAKEGNFAFSLQEGGLLCHLCYQRDRFLMPISATAIKLLRIFQYIDLSKLGKISVSDATKKELRTLLDAYYEKNAGLNLKSKRFLNQIETMKDVGF